MVLMVAILITLLSSFFVMRSQLVTQVYLRYQQNDRLLNNMQSAFDLLLSDVNVLEENSSKCVSLFDSPLDSVELYRKSWGAFELLGSRAFEHQRSFGLFALVGGQLTGSPTSLYVCDRGKPLALCGKAKLNGTCYVPESGFKRAYIEGQNYAGDQYVYGQQLKSKPTLPALEKKAADQIHHQFYQPISSDDSLVPAHVVEALDSIIHPFSQPTLVIESKGVLLVHQLLIKGNIKLIAPKIIVNSAAQLQDVLVIADEILIQKNNTSHAQFFARKSIELEEEVVLAYPSIVLYSDELQKENTPEQFAIKIAKNCKVNGDVIALKKQTSLMDPLVLIELNSIIHGYVFVQGRLSTQAEHHGFTFCDRFYLKTNSGIYENHILNARFDAAKLSPYYTGGYFLFKNHKREVVQWL